MESELWILMEDTHERHRVDGGWAAALGPLRAAKHPQVLCERRLADLVRGMLPTAEVECPEAEPSGLLHRIDPAAGDWFDLVELGPRPPGRPIARVRSFGVRAGVLGAALARRLSCRFTAFLLFEDDRVRAKEPITTTLSRRQRLVLEALILKRADSVETLSIDHARGLRAAHLVAPEAIRAWRGTGWPIPDSDGAGDSMPRPVPAAGPAARGASRRDGDGVDGSVDDLFGDRDDAATPQGGPQPTIAVLASGSDANRNREIIRAARDLSFRMRFQLLWLGRIEGWTARRASADLRRYGLAERFEWEDNPWESWSPLAPRAWDVLVVGSKASFGGPLVCAAREAGVPIVPAWTEGGFRTIAGTIETAVGAVPLSGVTNGR